MDKTLIDVPILTIDCNEEFVNNPDLQKKMMAKVLYSLYKVDQVYNRLAYKLAGFCQGIQVCWIGSCP